MVINSPGEFLINTSSVTVRWYGVLIAVGVLAAYFISVSEIRKKNLREDKFDSVFLITLLFGIIGARLGFVLQNTSYYGQHFSEVFKIWDGGLSIHGALILGFIALYLACKIVKIDFSKVANIIAPNVLLAGAIGRWGNFFNQEIIGRPTSFFLKIFIDPAHRLIGYEDIAYYHPVFLYESILLLIAFFVYRIFKQHFEQHAATYTLIIYSSIRVVVEFWRIDYKPIFAGLDLAQLVSCGIIVTTVAFYFTRNEP